MTMGLRAYLNEKPVVALSLVASMVIGAIVWLSWSMSAGSSEADLTRFYSIDDGRTWFRDSVHRVPPFAHNRSEAVAAYVFADGPREFVGFLERYSDEAAQRLTALDLPEDRFDLLDRLGPGAIQIKQPGVEGWFASDSPEARSIRQRFERARLVVP